MQRKGNKNRRGEGKNVSLGRIDYRLNRKVNKFSSLSMSSFLRSELRLLFTVPIARLVRLAISFEVRFKRRKVAVLSSIGLRSGHTSRSFGIKSLSTFSNRFLKSSQRP
jgi:hypothetical protein